MVKKLTSLLLVITIVITSISFSVSADELDDVQATLKMYYNFTLNGVSKTAYNLIPNQPFPLIINAAANTTYEFEIDRLYFLDQNTINQRYFINLKCGFFETHNTTGSPIQAFLSNNSFQNITNSTDFVFRNYPSLYRDQYKENQNPSVYYYWDDPGFWFYGAGNRKPSFDLDKSITFTYNPGNYGGSHILWIVFYDVNVLPDYNWLWYQLNTYLNSFQGYLVDILQNCYKITHRLTEEAIWSVSRDQFDSDGNFIGGQDVQVTWYDAIYQLLSNLYAPVKEQAEQDQKAKDAGALDALDGAYDAAGDAGSFWDLLDFFHFSSFGDYDSDNVEAIGDNMGDWFSDRVKNELDNVPVPRAPSETISDYYCQNMDSISDLLGGVFD